MNTSRLQRFAPALFVLLWSTGFIVARYGTKDAGPLTFLVVRCLVSATVLMVIARVTREVRLDGRLMPVQAAVGTGIHAMYLGGVWVAINHGMPSGITALIAALHPVLTAVLGAMFLKERLSLRRTCGVVLGFAGVIAVVVEHGGAGDGISSFALGAMVIAVVGMSTGTLIQRRFAHGTPLLAGTAFQYVTTAAILSVGAVRSEHWHFEMTQRTVLSLAWSVIVLSLAAILIMLWLLHRQAAAQVSSLFFLTPALSTVQGALLFQEHIGALAFVGLAIAAAGVWLATSAEKAISPQK